jgi:hypothetical protein
MKRGVLLASVLLAGCPKPASPGSGAVEDLRQWVQPSKDVHYVRVNRAAAMELPEIPVHERWQGPAFDGERVLYDVISENALTGRALDVTRLFFGREGFGYLGTVAADGGVEEWSPVQVVLPPNPTVGDSWTATHQKGASVSERSCEIMPGEACEDGLVVVCESMRDGGRVILRDHFCRGKGWSGFEAMVQTPGAPTVRMWSLGVVRDGRVMPSFLEDPDEDVAVPPP